MEKIKFKKFLSATICLGLALSIINVAFPRSVHAATEGTAKILSASQGGVASTDPLSLPWAVSSASLISLTFQITNSYTHKIQGVCIEAEVPGASPAAVSPLIDDTKYFTNSGWDLNVFRVANQTSYDTDGPSYNPRRWADSTVGTPVQDTICRGSLNIAVDSTGSVRFDGISPKLASQTNQDVIWVVTLITDDTSNVGSDGIFYLDQLGTKYHEINADVTTGGSLTQSVKAPVLSAVAPDAVYANSSATKTYTFTNPTSYIAAIGLVGFKFDPFSGDGADANFDFASSTGAGSIAAHAGDGSATGWSVTSGTSGSNRYIFFNDLTGVIAAGGGNNFAVNFKINDSHVHTSKMSWSYAIAGDAALADANTTGWSANVPWNQYGFEVTAITPSTATANTPTTATVSVLMHASGSASIRADLASSAGTIGTSSPEISTITQDQTVVFSFPYTTTTDSSSTLTASADEHVDTTWTPSSNTLVSTVNAGSAGSASGTDGSSTTTPASGPGRYSLLATMTMSQKIEFFIILLALLTLLCAGIYQYGPTVAAKIKHSISKRRNFE